MKKKILAGLAISVFLTCNAGHANATLIPSGIHNDVSMDTVINDWGWSVAYRGDYSDSNVTYDDLFGSVGEYVMIGAIRDDLSTFDVLAATSLSELTTITARDVTHESNGANWYYNDYSMGFAGIGDTIRQLSADINGRNERDRLSWHSDNPLGDPSGIVVNGGWRSGNNTGLNGSTNWDRVVLTYNGANPVPGNGANSVPEPTAMLLLGTGIAGLVGTRIRRKKK
jgi:hypothetical protein